jgi:hypothetical protein
MSEDESGIWISPNGVKHLVLRGRCATCGKGPHEPVEPEDEYEQRGAELVRSQFGGL